MPEPSVQALLEDMCEAGKKIFSYTAGMRYDEFCKDPKTVDAVVRNFEIMSEAANRIPDDFTGLHPEVEWQQIAGLRHRITPDGLETDLQTLWQIKEEVLPELLEEATLLAHTP